MTADEMIIKEAAKEAREGKEAEENEAEDSEPEDSPDSFLTERQLDVLQLRHQGLSQQEIAEMLGTTRSNISILEKRAQQNIARAQRTLNQWMMICAPISLFVEAGTDVFQIPAMIFDAADERDIKLPVSSLDIVVQLQKNAPQLFKKRALERDTLIYVTEDGEVMVKGAG